MMIKKSLMFLLEMFFVLRILEGAHTLIITRTIVPVLTTQGPLAMFNPHGSKLFKHDKLYKLICLIEVPMNHDVE